MSGQVDIIIASYLMTLQTPSVSGKNYNFIILLLIKYLAHQ